MSYLPIAPNPIRYQNRVLRVLLGIGSGMRDYLLLFNSDAGSGCRDKPRSLDWLPTVADAEEKTLVPLAPQIPRLFERNILNASGSKGNGA